jgi:uncharacterized membrane protein YkoI
MMKKTLTAAALGLILALSLSACGGGASGAVSQSDREKASEAALKATGGGAVTDAERGDDDDKYAYEVEVTFDNGSDTDVELDENFKVLNNPPKASDFAAKADASAPAEPEATPDARLDADDRPLTGETLRKASAAALKATERGKVIETGGSDDRDHAYEVDVLLPNGEDLTVELDKAFKVTKIDR